MNLRIFFFFLAVAGDRFWTDSAADRVASAPSHRRPPQPITILRWGVKIPMRDKVELNATLYVPKSNQRQLAHSRSSSR